MNIEKWSSGIIFGVAFQVMFCHDTLKGFEKVWILEKIPGDVICNYPLEMLQTLKCHNIPDHHFIFKLTSFSRDRLKFRQREFFTCQVPLKSFLYW